MNRSILYALMLGLVTSLSSCNDSAKENGGSPWQSLFNGTDLDGWTQMGGAANYEVKDNMIVGKTVANTPNSFLTTDEEYDDFILELEYKVDPSMNSGIQIRSESKPEYQNGRVHGYQIEIDPSDRAWSAGIYDEARRGWLYTLDSNPTAQSAFKQNEWNKYRIEALGDTIRTWINGVEAAHLIDDKTASGFIALQVHSIGGDDEPGTPIMWRDIRIITENPSEHAKEMNLKPKTTDNSLTSSEKDDDWELLFDGERTDEWRGAKLDEFPDHGWEVNDGVLTVLASGGEESTAGGDIVTKKQYKDFELKVDFKITEGANSGIKYYVDTELNKGAGSSIGLEYQILDDERHPDAKLGAQEGSRTMASLYDLIQADPNKPVNPIGEWNTAHIISKGDHVEHWLNGMKVLEYERKSPEFRRLVSESKYDKWPDFGELDKGNILLQDHGNRVSFKNIKIKKLN